MSNDLKNIKIAPQSDLDLTKLLDSLENNQKKSLGKLITVGNVGKLRKTVYLSSGGKYYKYADFLLSFVYKQNYVPIHPISTLNYFISTISHNNNKSEIVKDCFSLMLDCDELWVFEEKYPSFLNNKSGSDVKHISEFPEGVLAEIYFWLINKPNCPIRFFTWKDACVPKYLDRNIWGIIPEESVDTVINTDAQSRFAIIDLGSSTVKLTVCKIEENKEIGILNKKAITVNLAENYFEDNFLKESAINRTLEAIADLQSDALGFGVIDIKLVGTGVVRKAKNAKEFMDRIKERVGLSLELLSGQDEARLIYKAVIDSIDRKNNKLLVVNAGGGSTEIVFEEDGKIKQYSLPIGVSNLNEKYLHQYPISDQNYEEMREGILHELSLSIPEFTKLDYLVYTGGELDYMVITGFELENSGINSLSHPKLITLENFKKRASEMRQLELVELQGYMPTNPNWMNGAIASNVILETLAEYFKVNRIIPSNKNLNDGLLGTLNN